MSDVVKCVIRDDDKLGLDTLILEEMDRPLGDFDSAECFCIGTPEHHCNHRARLGCVIRHPCMPEAHIPHQNRTCFDGWLERCIGFPKVFEIDVFDDAIRVATVGCVEVGGGPELY